MKTTSGNKDLIYREVLTNIGGAYNAETGETKDRINFKPISRNLEMDNVSVCFCCVSSLVDRINSKFFSHKKKATTR